MRVFLLILLLLYFLCLAFLAEHEKADLSNGYYMAAVNKGAIIVAPDGKVAVGPNIEGVFGKYPFIHGAYPCRSKYSNFILNTETGEVEKFNNSWTYSDFAEKLGLQPCKNFEGTGTNLTDLTGEARYIKGFYKSIEAPPGKGLTWFQKLKMKLSRPELSEFEKNCHLQLLQQSFFHFIYLLSASMFFLFPILTFAFHLYNKKLMPSWLFLLLLPFASWILANIGILFYSFSGRLVSGRRILIFLFLAWAYLPLLTVFVYTPFFAIAMYLRDNFFSRRKKVN